MYFRTTHYNPWNVGRIAGIGKQNDIVWIAESHRKIGHTALAADQRKYFIFWIEFDIEIGLVPMSDRPAIFGSPL
jgi:hypothetical protein